MTFQQGQSRKKGVAIACLLTAPRISDAAAAAGISQSTLERWLRDPAFVAAYRAAQRQALAQAIAGLQAAAGVAVSVLRSVMLDSSASPTARASAARSVLDLALRGAEFADIEERLSAIETALEVDNGGMGYARI